MVAWRENERPEEKRFLRNSANLAQLGAPSRAFLLLVRQYCIPVIVSRKIEAILSD